MASAQPLPAVLPSASRIRRSREFTETISRGTRAGQASLVVHLQVPAPALDPAPGARAGFVVSRSVGNAVARNLVVRRLRALVAARLDTLPAGSRLVVRALPGSAASSSRQLADDLDRALTRALERTGRVRTGGPRRSEAGSTPEGRVR